MATLSFQGAPLQTNGQLPAIGSDVPDFNLVGDTLTELSLADFAGQKKILVIVPSFDTPTCVASLQRFNQKAPQLPNTVVIAISADLPFAQCRCCTSQGLKNIIALSCFRSTFAADYGIKILDGLLTGLTARAVVIVNEHNQVIYTELVRELSEEPDYESALAVCKAVEQHNSASAR